MITLMALPHSHESKSKQALLGICVFMLLLMCTGQNEAQSNTPSNGTWRGAWSGSNSYAVNDVVTYLGATYTNVAATAPLSTPSSSNLFDSSAAVSNVVIDSSNGAEVSIGGFHSTGYVNVAGSASFVTNITIGIFVPYGVSFYDSNKQWLASSFLNGNGYFPAGVPISVPTSASFARFWWNDVAMGTTLDQAVINAGTVLQMVYSPYNPGNPSSSQIVTPCAAPTDAAHWAVINAGSSTAGPWSGKKMFVLGDSIVWANTDVARQIALRIGATLSSKGASAPGVDAFPGRGFDSFLNGQGPNGYVPLSASVISDVDLMVVALGTNQDSSSGLGSISDTPSYSGSMSAQMRLMLETIMGWKPGMRVVVVGPYQSNRYNVPAGEDGLQGSPDSGGTTANQQSITILRNINSQMKAVCSLYGVPYIDMYSESGVNFSTSALWLTDNLHPNQAGYSTMYVPYISAQLARFVQQ